MPIYGPVEEIPIVSVNIIGNRNVPTAKIQSMLMTRKDGIYDSQTVQRDVRTLVESGMFHNVDVFKEEVAGGKSVTFRLEERPVIQYVRYIGNEKVKDKKLDKELNLKPGDPLNRFTVEEARRTLESLYRERGFADVHAEIIEGTEPDDQGVVFQIHEGSVQRIYEVEFVGNQIASDARLKTQIRSKPGMISDLSVGLLWRFAGKAQMDEIAQDVDRLTAYYRSLGFFRARVGRSLSYNDDHTKLTLQFVIDEGVRYKIQDVVLEGNATFPAGNLMAQTESRAGEYFNLATLQRDLSSLRDHYGGQGYIFADVRGEPRFHETPGALDIVYKIDEGKQYRVGRVIVNIDGETTHTRRTVVLNHLSIRPGDIVDIREIRASERRLQASNLFLHNPAAGVTPSIVVKPPELEDLQYAEQPTDRPGRTVRGQQPTTALRPVSDVVDLIFQGTAKLDPSERAPVGPEPSSRSVPPRIFGLPSWSPLMPRTAGHEESPR